MRTTTTFGLLAALAAAAIPGFGQMAPASVTGSTTTTPAEEEASPATPQECATKRKALEQQYKQQRHDLIHGSDWKTLTRAERRSRLADLKKQFQSQMRGLKDECRAMKKEGQEQQPSEPAPGESTPSSGY